MNSMKSWSRPTPEQIDGALDRLTRKEHHRYFFRKLGNPEWILPLKEKGYFKNPDALEEIEFLARVAPEMPELVTDIFTSYVAVRNQYTIDEIVKAGTKVPGRLAGKIALKAIKWLGSSDLTFTLPEDLLDLGIYLGREGHIKEARRVLELVFSLKRAPNEEESVRLFGHPQPPVPRYWRYEFDQLIKTRWEKITDAVKLQALDVFCEGLRKYIRTRNYGSSPFDLFRFFRYAVENNGRERLEDVGDQLITVVTEVSVHLVKSGLSSLQEVVSVLARYEWNIFRRIELYLLSCFPERDISQVEESILDAALFSDLSHEYSLLLTSGFPLMQEKKRQQYLRMVERGPENPEKEKKTSGDDLDHWRFRRLSPIRNNISGYYAEVLSALSKKLGLDPNSQPVYPTSPTAEWIGPTSPKSDDELKSMSVEEVIDFFRYWEPSKDPRMPSPEGLGRSLTSVVEQDPQKYADQAVLFEGLEPTYIRSLFFGLRQALTNGKSFHWDAVTQLIGWVIRQGVGEIENQIIYLERDPGWKWTRQAIATLFSEGLSRKSIPYNFRSSVWTVLRILADDSHPTPKEEEEAISGGWDYFDFSINTTRGEAFHACVRYGLWVREHVQSLSDNRVFNGMSDIPELAETLERHLDIDHDRSLTIRSVFGRWLPWLASLDMKWTTDRIAKVLPMEESMNDYREVAWNTYLHWCRPYDDMLSVLREYYLLAVNTLDDSASDEQKVPERERNLVHHLMVFYARGLIALNEDLMRDFWSHASVGLRAYAIRFVGISLEEDKTPVPQPFLERLMILFDKLLESAVTSLDLFRVELKQFGWWFDSDKFPIEWRLSRLIEVLTIVGEVEPDLAVASKLAEASAADPLGAIKAIFAMVKGDRRGWSIHSWRSDIIKIVGNACQKGGEDGRKVARELIDYAGTIGFHELRPFLDECAKPAL